MDRSDYENENERVAWKKSINFMYYRKDLEGLKDLRGGPEDLDEDLIELLDTFIEELEKGEKTIE